jgi:hypothetical protein
LRLTRERRFVDQSGNQRGKDGGVAIPPLLFNPAQLRLAPPATLAAMQITCGLTILDLNGRGENHDA